MSYGIIYVITNNINGKVYVGQTRKGLSVRWSGHKKRSKYPGRNGEHLKSAFSKYGFENFSIKQVAEASSYQDLQQLEIKWIKDLNSMERTVGYNKTSGGDSPEIRLGNEHCRPTKQCIEKSTEARLGVPKSTEARAKMSAARKAHWDKRQGEARKLTPEHTAKLAEHLKLARLKISSSEVRAKMSRSAKSRWEQPCIIQG